MKSWSNIKKEHEEHVTRLLNQFPQLEYQVDSVAYNGVVALYICGDVEIVNKFFRLYYMYAEYLKRKEIFLKKVGKNNNKA